MNFKFTYFLIFNVLIFNAQNNIFNKIPNNSKSIWQQNTTINEKGLSSFNNDNLSSSISYRSDLIQTNSVFKKYILKDANVAYSNDLIETTPNNYVLIGQTYDTIGTQLHWRLTLTGIDQNYNQIWKKSYGNNNFSYTHYLFAPIPLIKKGGFLYSILFAQDSNYKQPGIFIKFNFSGDTIWQKKYYVNNDEFFITSLCPSVDNGFLITGAVQTSTPSYNNHPYSCEYLLKTDADGNKLWDKRFYKTNLDETQIGYKVIQDSLTKKIIMVGVQDVGSTQYSNIMILDSLGNLITQKGSNGSFGSALLDIIKLKDENYIGVGGTAHPDYIVNGDVTASSSITKFDINGTLIFKKDFDTLTGNNTFNRILANKNDDFYIGGALSTLYNHNMGINDLSRIMKVDKDGNLLWKKYFDNYTNNSNQDGLSGMIQSSDGNIVFTNYLNSGNVPRPLNYSFYKTDTTSCDANSIGCYTYVGLKENESQKQNIKIYPNPASDFCNINLNGLSNFRTISIDIKNVLGQTLFKLNTDITPNYYLNISNFSKGLYIISITQNNQILAEQKLIIIK
jgi:hypothetical protein